MPICEKLSFRQAIHDRLLNQRPFALSSLALPLVLGICVAASAPLAAQDTSSGKPAAGTGANGQTSADETSKKSTAMPPVRFYNLLQDKSIVFPDIAHSTEPLTTGGKFELFVDNSISLHAITGSMLGAAIGQADDSPTGFGQGWDAYAKRFGASMGRQASTEFFSTFLLSAALHEDPRFYPEDKPSFGHAVKYSVKRVFITRNDGGADVVNIAGLAGPAMAEGLANVYWPDRNRTVGDTLLRYGIDLASKAGANMLREYWPVVYGKVHHVSHSSSQQ